MKAVVRAILKQEWLILVSALVKVVPEFVMDGNEIFIANLNAHFDTNIVFVVDVPGAGVTDNIAICRLGE